MSDGFGDEARSRFAGKIGLNEGKVHITANKNYTEKGGTIERPQVKPSRHRGLGISPGKAGNTSSVHSKEK